MEYKDYRLTLDQVLLGYGRYYMRQGRRGLDNSKVELIKIDNLKYDIRYDRDALIKFDKNDPEYHYWEIHYNEDFEVTYQPSYMDIYLDEFINTKSCKYKVKNYHINVILGIISFELYIVDEYTYRPTYFEYMPAILIEMITNNIGDLKDINKKIDNIPLPLRYERDNYKNYDKLDKKKKL